MKSRRGRIVSHLPPKPASLWPLDAYVSGEPESTDHIEYPRCSVASQVEAFCCQCWSTPDSAHITQSPSTGHRYLQPAGLVELVVHRCLNSRAPQYLADHGVQLSSLRHLRSAEQNLLHVPRDTDSARTTAPLGCLHCWFGAWNSVTGPVCNPNATEATFIRLL